MASDPVRRPSAGSGGLCTKPCEMVQPYRRSALKVTSLSTPSATRWAPRLCANATVDRTMGKRSGAWASRATNILSSFSSSIDTSCRRASDDHAGAAGAPGWRFNPPPGEWRDRTGSSTKALRVEDTSHTCRRSNFDLAETGLPTTFRMPTSMRIAIESNELISELNPGWHEDDPNTLYDSRNVSRLT
jgi:hypothetical protein